MTTYSEGENERLMADKAAISQTASDYLHEIERLRVENARLQVDISYSMKRIAGLQTENARLVTTITRIRSVVGTSTEAWKLANDALEGKGE